MYSLRLLLSLIDRSTSLYPLVDSVVKGVREGFKVRRCLLVNKCVIGWSLNMLRQAYNLGERSTIYI
jgi:hypothetical protein